MTTFTELPLSAALQQKLAAAQFITLTPIQARAIAPALEGKDVIGTAQTGTGKTLAFLIPIIEMLRAESAKADSAKSVKALVLLPTRELAQQVHEQYEQLRGKNMPKAALVIGGVAEKAQINSLRSGCEFVIATPGRLQDFITRKFADLRHVKILVLDEADRMLDMAFFRPSGAFADSAAAPADTVLLRHHGAVGGFIGERLYARPGAGCPRLDPEARRERETRSI